MKKLLNPVKKLWVIIQTCPNASALIVGGISGLILAIGLLYSMPAQRSIIMVVEYIFFSTVVGFLCFGGLIYFGCVTIFGQKQMDELGRRALDSELRVMINQALIENGSIKKKEDLLTADDFKI